MKKLSQSRRSMESVLPKKAKWIRDAAAQFNPNDNEVVTKQGHIISYELLIIAVGLQLNYSQVSNYSDYFCLRNSLFCLEKQYSLAISKYCYKYDNSLRRYPVWKKLYRYQTEM